MTMVIVLSFAHERKTLLNDCAPEPLTQIVQSPTKQSFLNYITLQPFLNKIKSYIRDNIHFLNSIPQNTDTFMVTFDVTNLYNNIHHELGKQAIWFWIEKYPETLHLRFN